MTCWLRLTAPAAGAGEIPKAATSEAIVAGVKATIWVVLFVSVALWLCPVPCGAPVSDWQVDWSTTFSSVAGTAV
jgi:hypothetical protein